MNEHKRRPRCSRIVSGRLAFSERDLDELGILSRPTRWRMRRDRAFPEPVTAGGRKLYRAQDIHTWLDDPTAWAEANRG